ncbi:hypothetical protein SAMN00777080_3961 [Aquiflexum balticum DSM 16537]|jgi:hypothetical protein|uniref:Uncharacterized protein n=1 Tax=Aquiflexum balticum DSM 16537 TaxID=758820 RepID=A0A1W2H9B9_9BACT|nr:hypothetical protein SAMN00777080_3961 [Aquiflexum balticum DSM 16537]
MTGNLMHFRVSMKERFNETAANMALLNGIG